MKPIIKKPTAKPLAPSKLGVVDIPLEDLIPDDDNPNEMAPATLDLLIEEIRENGFDEPIQVRPHPTIPGKYQISGGHHRVKAATVVGLQSVPAIIKDLDDRKQKIALVKRNALRGDFNKLKFAKLFNDLAKGAKDPVQLQRELGYSDPKKIDILIAEAAKNMTPTQKKKLADAKESIKSMDDLSSVLNRIFKESGSEMDKGYMVFSYGGKEHHYFQIDDETNDAMKRIKAQCDKTGQSYVQALQSIVTAAAPAPVKAVPKKKPIKK
jgi:ParB/RepB/Spo0J family partition protein